MAQTLPRPNSMNKQIAEYFFELLNGVTKVHLNHLLISGANSFAAHEAMGDFYDSLSGKIDDLVEEWQGLTETLVDFPTSANFPKMTNSKECLNYLRELYNKSKVIQTLVSDHSEIVNTIDEIKSLINKTKYKLLFLQ